MHNVNTEYDLCKWITLQFRVPIQYKQHYTKFIMSTTFWP